MKYIATVSVDTGKLMPKVGEIMVELNDTMTSFGFKDKVQARTDIGIFSIEADRELTHAELEEIRAKAEVISREHKPEWDFRIGPLHRAFATIPPRE